MNAVERKPLYTMPQAPISPRAELSEGKAFLIGTDKGLFKVGASKSSVQLWAGGSVEQILRAQVAGEDGKVLESWYFRTDKGILFSQDLARFELRNEGLPFLTIKKYENKQTTFEKRVHTLKDIGINPLNQMQLVTATKDSVYISRDGGLHWKSLGSMSRSTAGLKAVAIANMPKPSADGGSSGTELVVFMAHPIFGLAYMKPDAAKPAWIDVSAGFDMMKSLSMTDEISDILPVAQHTDGESFCDVYMAQSYMPRIYKFNWGKRRAECIFRGREPAASIDGLFAFGDTLMYSKIEGFGAINMRTQENPGTPEKLAAWKSAFSSAPGAANAAWIPADKTGFGTGLCLNELWMLYPGTVNTPYALKAANKKSLYVSAYQCRLQAGIDKFKRIINDNKLNSLVIDMKDDYGLLRYDAKDPAVLEKAKITQYAVNLDHFVEEFKKNGTYLIARIVTFKDRNLAAYGGAKYAVWDSATKGPWVGTRGYKDIVNEKTGEITGKEALYYDERWVDPYSPEVWEYNILVARELIARGFDEIQFDYIRFPTDGLNLRHAAYRWKSDGMDKESALMSFLAYARANIAAPIGIDIYGANGWYRSGTRTGQDVEMLAEYVDVIGPMFYPSHFEQSFLNYEPYPDRTYRIYYYGTFRNTVMARNRAIVRPWVQAFKLNVSYDRAYYGASYVQKQIFGVRDSVNNGYMYWNNSGEYATILPDIGDDALYSGAAAEAAKTFRKPAMGSARAPFYSPAPEVSSLDAASKTDGDAEVWPPSDAEAPHPVKTKSLPSAAWKGKKKK